MTFLVVERSSMFEVFTFFVETVICQMDELVLELRTACSDIDLFIFFSGKSH